MLALNIFHVNLSWPILTWNTMGRKLWEREFSLAKPQYPQLSLYFTLRAIFSFLESPFPFSFVKLSSPDFSLPYSMPPLLSLSPSLSPCIIWDMAPFLLPLPKYRYSNKFWGFSPFFLYIAIPLSFLHRSKHWYSLTPGTSPLDMMNRACGTGIKHPWIQIPVLPLTAS